MKKFPILMSLLLIAAMVLSACASADNDNDNDTPGSVDATPGVVATDAVMETPAGPGAEMTPTVEPVQPTAAATEAVVETPATGDVTPTAEGSTGAIPQTGVEDDCNPRSLQGLLDMDVVDASGSQIADVSRVIILRDAKALGSSQNLDKSASGNTGATNEGSGDTAATPTAAADNGAANGAGDNAAAFTAMAAPQAAYLVLDVENQDNDVVVPLSAFDLTVKSQGVGGMNNTNDPNAQVTPPVNAAGTPVAGDNGPANDLANEAVVCAITLKGVQADALGQAPAFKDDMDFSAADWDNEFRAYWSGQGMSIPATGAGAAMGAPVVIDDTFNNIDARSVDGEDIGEVEDFLIDGASGNFTHAVLAVGGFLGLGEKYVPVPMNLVQWTSKDAETDDTGEVTVNVTGENLKNAPSFDSTKQINPSVSGWDSDVQSFWNSLKND